MNSDTILNEIYNDKNPNVEDKTKKFIEILENILGTKFIEHTDGKNDRGIDAIYFTQQNESGIVFQIKTSENFDNSENQYENKTVLDSHEGKIDRLIRDAKEGKVVDSHEKVRIFSKLIRENKIKNITAYFVTFKRIYDDLKSEYSSEDLSGRVVNGIKIYFCYFDKSNIDGLISKLWYNKDYHLNVKGQSTDLKVCKKKYIVHDEKSITIELTLSKLKNFISKFTNNLEDKHALDSLTNSNARDFLGFNENNKNIKNTITSENFQENHLYHMGIIMVCENFTFDERKHILNVTSPSFANGAQTIGTIMGIPEDKCKGKTKFILRIIKTNEKNLTKKIVLFSNSQTTITEDMKYGFDEDQQKLFCFLAKYGYFYKNRFFSEKSKKIWEKRIKRINEHLPTFKNPFISLLKENSKIKLSFLGQAMHVIQKPDEYGKAYNSLDLFRYNPNDYDNGNPKNDKAKNYKKTFFELKDSSKKTFELKKIEEYIVPFLIVEEIKKNKDLFSSNRKTEFTEETIKLTPGDILKLKLFLTAKWVKKIEEKTDDVIGKTLEFIKKRSFRKKIREFIKNFKDDLEKKDTKIFNFFQKIGNVTAIAKNKV